MGFRATVWAWQQEGLSSAEKLALLALTDEANSAGNVTWKGQPRLCAKTGQCRTTMKRVLQNLVDKGLIDLEQYVVHLRIPAYLLDDRVPAYKQ